MCSLASKQGPRYRHTAGEEEPYETIARREAHPDHRRGDFRRRSRQAGLGRCALQPPVDEIHRALAENLVIFFRDQHITPQQHLAFGRKFGELHIHPAAPMSRASRR